MHILQVHNSYQLSGGEDVVLENERRLLESNGNSVFQYRKDNKEISEYSFLKKANLIKTSVWSKESFFEIKELIKIVKPDICHVHNYMPLISPSVFSACRDMKVSVVQTLHNYRMLCANAYLFRDGKICEECVGKSLYHGVSYACYQSSRIKTFAVARIMERNKKSGTWKKSVDRYIVLTNFSKNKFIQGGLPRYKIFVKPNFLIDDPGYSGKDENYLIFAGRLDEAKGINVLIEAANKIPAVEFKVAGTGPFKGKVTSVPNIEYLGHLKRDDLLKRIKNSSALVFPSIWYETFGLLIIEAFACGKPVIASNMGAMAELIEDGKTGLLFEPGNSLDLADKINWAWEHKEEMRQMGLNARKEYEEKYTAEKNYKILMDIYGRAIENHSYSSKSRW